MNDKRQGFPPGKRLASHLFLNKKKGNRMSMMVRKKTAI
jgi:hypothetical protein